MFEYSPEALKKYPWLWKYDKRFTRSCFKRGHRYHWVTAIRSSSYIQSIGFCRYCSKACTASVYTDKSKGLVKIVQVKVNQKPIVMSKSEIEGLMGMLKERGLLAAEPPKPVLNELNTIDNHE